MNTFCYFLFSFLTLSGVIFPQFELPEETSELFSGSGVCVMCHTSNGSSVLTYKGRDISPVTGWRSSIMANSSKDPLWRAMVAAEILEFPELSREIESTCTRCHAPMGYTQAINDGRKHYTMKEMKADPLSNDGVSCTVCHQIQPDNFGKESSFTGGYIITGAAEIYGPYEDPFPNPMINHTGYTPLHGPHIAESELCGTCHTLFTPVVENGKLTRSTFPEQMTYPEWKNSIYPGNGIECKNCHMSRIEEGIDIARMPPWHKTLRSPFSEHDFRGANAFMASILAQNAENLNLTASPGLFEVTKESAQKFLQKGTVQLSLDAEINGTMLIAKVQVKNLTGHKLPTGIPLRRMWIHLKVHDGDGRILFESGSWDERGEITGKNRDFEPHHHVITSGDQIQIYEPVLKDYLNNKTLSLLSASGYLKDNRLPPAGFRSDHEFYDILKPVGTGEDKDFNLTTAGVEGSGTDITEYRIPLKKTKSVKIEAEICYQTLKPEIAEYMFSHQHPDIEVFKKLYYEERNYPVILSSAVKMLKLE